MRDRIRAIFQRECAALFLSPLAWSVSALAALAAGLAFAQSGLEPGAPASLGPMMRALSWALLIAAPALAVRSTTEERRTGYWEVLATGPASQLESSLARLIALGIACALMVIPAIAVAFAAMEWSGSPDFGEAACGALGLWLAGMAFASSAMAVGALSASPVVAFLAVVFGWLMVAGAVKTLPLALPPDQADWVFAADPFKRLDNFLVGILDSSDVAYFASLIALFTACSIAACGSEAERNSRVGFQRWVAWIRPMLFALACLVTAASVAIIARADSIRESVDATKSRLYSLSEPTRELLGSLQGKWAITLLVDRSGADAAALAQAEEVMERIAEATRGSAKGSAHGAVGGAASAGAQMRARTIDAADPRQAGEFSTWLEELETSSRATVEQYEQALDESMESFLQLRELARTELPGLDRLSAALAEGTQERRQVDSLRSAYRQMLDASAQFMTSVETLRSSSPGRPFPDWTQAASVMIANDGYWSAQLAALATWLSTKVADASAPAALRSAAPDLGRRAESVAIQLRKSQDALERLPRLELGAVSAAIAAGDAAVIESPQGIAVVPGWQLLPRGSDEGAVVRFDRRFRGEQALGAAIRALVDPSRPRAVFVHASGQSLLKPSTSGADLAGAVDALRLARWDVEEWIVGVNSRPAETSAPTAWIILQPARATLEPTESDRALLAGVNTLVDEGAGLLVSVGPSLLPIAGRQDPWSSITAVMQATADTGTQIVDEIPISEGQFELRPAEIVAAIPSVVGEADEAGITAAAPSNSSSQSAFTPAGRLLSVLAGQRFSFGNSVPVQGSPLLEARARPGRFLVSDWRRAASSRRRTDGTEVKESISVVALATRGVRSGPVARGVVVGSPDWLLSTHLSRAEFIGSREMLVAPGNRQLLLSACAWLAGLDERIGAVDASRDVPRIGPMGTLARTLWSSASVIGLPTALLLLGWTVWLRRNRA